MTAQDEVRVVAFYAWCMAQLDVQAAPTRLLKGAGRYPQPVALLARLGVDTQHEGNGLGAGLLVDAITRLLALSGDIGCGGLIIHEGRGVGAVAQDGKADGARDDRENDDARAFYLRLVPELETSPTDPLHLVLLMKDARTTLLP